MEQILYQTMTRAKRIDMVEIALLKIKKNKKILDEEKFTYVICEQFNCSVRTAREYIKIAKSRIPGGMLNEEWKKD